MVSTFDVAEVRARVDRLAAERRALEAEIQAINWTVDLS
jgi:outer membrane murein-binding lipoprotein Lpp